jgi:hypothetical protein
MDHQATPTIHRLASDIERLAVLLAANAAKFKLPLSNINTVREMLENAHRTIGSHT